MIARGFPHSRRIRGAVSVHAWESSIVDGKRFRVCSYGEAFPEDALTPPGDGRRCGHLACVIGFRIMDKWGEF